MKSRRGPELQELIGETAFARLAEAFGGTRLYVPLNMHPGHEISAAIGAEAAAVLTARLAPDVIRVPLAHDVRARQYRAAGRTNAQIARMLGMTEGGVTRLFQRMQDAPTKGSAVRDVANDASDQMDLFKGR